MATTNPKRRLLEKVPGMFGPIFVEARGSRRSMRFGARDEVVQSLVDLERPERPVPAYLRAAAWSLSLNNQTRRALVVGLGGGGFIRFLRKRFPRTEIDIVEIDPAVIEIARSRFGIRQSSRTRIHNTDAILHLTTDANLYDFILLDAYDGPTLSSRFFSADFFSLAAASLENGGICAANLSLRTRKEESVARQRFATAFPAGSMEVVMPSDHNRLLVGSEAALPTTGVMRSIARSMDRNRTFAFPVTPFASRARLLRQRRVRQS